jgi:negative regulator of flagellin synthesis FlgM
VGNSIKALGSGSVAASGGSPIEQVRPSTSVNTATSSPRSNADSVEITDSARLLASLAQAVQDAPEIDPQRVQVLQQSIESGQYTINPERVADGLLQFEQSFGAAG